MLFDKDRFETDVNFNPRPATSSNEFSPAELQSFKVQLLEEKKNTLLKVTDRERLQRIVYDKSELLDELDVAAVIAEQNVAIELLERDKRLLRSINHALEKIENGEFGYCEGTGELIPKRRLEVRPWCRYSVRYKERLERLKKSGRGVNDEEE